MILLPPHLYRQYRLFCTDKGISDNEFADHLKWLRYFLDFCEKYQITGNDADRIRLFLDKLRQKGQTDEKRQQARKAVSLYFNMISCGVNRHPPELNEPTVQSTCQRVDLPIRSLPLMAAMESFYNVAGYQETSDSPEDDDDLHSLRAGSDGQGGEEPAGFGLVGRVPETATGQ